MTTTSGLQTFDLSFDDLLSEAYGRVYGDAEITGRDALEARRSLNLLLIDLANRNIPLASLEEHVVTVSQSVADYTVSSNVMSILFGVLERNDIETQLTRISLFDYKAIPNKLVTGKPTQYTVHRDRDNITLKLWPLPDNSTDEFKYWAFMKIEDVTKQDQLIDLHVKYLPALVSGLAYYLAMKKDPTNTEFITRLKQDYEETLMTASDSDQEKSSMYVVPILSRI